VTFRGYFSYFKPVDIAANELCIAVDGMDLPIDRRLLFHNMYPQLLSHATITHIAQAVRHIRRQR